MINIPTDWVTAKLGDICIESQYGLNSPSNGGRYPILGMKNIRDGNIELSNLAYVDLTSNELQKYKLYAGDLLINRTNSIDLVGKTALFNLHGDYVFASYLVRFIIDKQNADPKYVNYYCNSHIGINQMRKLATKGVSQANINPTELKKNFRIPLPPLSEQQKIAEILSTWDDAIALTERLITALQSRKMGLLQRLMSGETRFEGFEEEWTIVRLDARINEFIVPMRDKPKLFKGKIPWCRIEDFDGIYLHKSKSGQCVDEEIVEQMKLKVYPVGTVVCSCSADLGRCAITAVPLITNQTFIGLVPNNGLDSLFLYYYLSFNSKKLQRLSSGTTIAYLSRNEFEKFVITIPPNIDEQRKISNLLYQCDMEIELAKTYRENILRQKKGLMQRLLTGEVRVKV